MFTLYAHCQNCQTCRNLPACLILLLPIFVGKKYYYFYKKKFVECDRIEIFFDLFIQNSFMLQWIQKYTDTLCEYCLIRWSNRFFFILQIMQHSKIGTKRNALCLREREKEKLKITYIQTNGKNDFDFSLNFFWKKQSVTPNFDYWFVENKYGNNWWWKKRRMCVFVCLCLLFQIYSNLYIDWLISWCFFICPVYEFFCI